MKKIILFYFIVLSACNQVQRKNTASGLQKLSPLLPTANWQIIDGSDTSYIYFSQQFDNSYKIYEYKLAKGDSTLTHEGSIKVAGDSIVWDWNNHLLHLEAITDTKTNWKEKKSKEDYVLQKINDSLLQFRSSVKQWWFRKTLPLSAFLVRSKYDYEHGTRYLDSAEVPPRKPAHK